jgi:hypothetical protein
VARPPATLIPAGRTSVRREWRRAHREAPLAQRRRRRRRTTLRRRPARSCQTSRCASSSMPRLSDSRFPSVTSDLQAEGQTGACIVKTNLRCLVPLRWSAFKLSAKTRQKTADAHD